MKIGEFFYYFSRSIQHTPHLSYSFPPFWGGGGLHVRNWEKAESLIFCKLVKIRLRNFHPNQSRKIFRHKFSNLTRFRNLNQWIPENRLAWVSIWNHPAPGSEPHYHTEKNLKHFRRKYIFLLKFWLKFQIHFFRDSKHFLNFLSNLNIKFFFFKILIKNIYYFGQTY